MINLIGFLLWFEPLDPLVFHFNVCFSQINNHSYDKTTYIWQNWAKFVIRTLISGEKSFQK